MRKDTLHPVVILLPTKTHGQVMNDSEKKVHQGLLARLTSGAN